MSFSSKLRYRILFAFAIIASVWTMMSGDAARSFSAGAPAGYCNAPSNGGSTCFTCHNTGPTPATIPGLITSNIPVGGYVPGATYTVTATVAGVGHNRFGFEISPQDNNGNLLGSMNDLGTETMFQQSGVYITHSTNSTLNMDSKSWQFEWTAPVAGTGNVTFYGAFNISNNDGSYTGDTIVLSTMTSIENTGLSVAGNNNETNMPVVWFADNNTLHVSGISGELETVTVFDMNGQLIWKSEPSAASQREEHVLSGAPIHFARGVYLVNIQSENNFWSMKMLNAN